MSAPSRKRRDPQSIAAERRFRTRITELGGRVVGEWRDAHTPVATICPKGHECSTPPSSIRNGSGMCRICGPKEAGRKRRLTAELAFMELVKELGGQILGKYVSSQTRIDAICPAGHPCRPRPDHLLQGVGMCPVCSQRDSSTAAANFQHAVEARGGEVLGRYAGAHTRVLVRCVAGHHCLPLPNQVQQGGALCPTCSGRDPVAAEARFRHTVADAGGEVLGEYVNARQAVLLRCAAGHLCSPTPDDVRQGQGICHQCRYDWSTFYVLINPTRGRVKIGVTSADPRPRLKAHRGRGYTEVVRVLRDFPGAFRLEQHIVVTLRDAGIPAVQGREYFDMVALAVVLDVVDGWAPEPRAEPSGGPAAGGGADAKAGVLPGDDVVGVELHVRGTVTQIDDLGGGASEGVPGDRHVVHPVQLDLLVPRSRPEVVGDDPVLHARG